MKYKDICQEPAHSAKVANNNIGLEVDNDGNMVEYPVMPITGEYDTIPYDYEIWKPFFKIGTGDHNLNENSRMMHF